MTEPSAAAPRGIDALDDFYERAPCGYLITSPEGTLLEVNQTFLNQTGYARADLVGARTFAELLTPGGRIYHETHYAPMLRMQGSVREIALDVVCADGARLPVLVNSVLERDDTGRDVVIRTAVFDATERREYERELLRAKERAEESEARASALARTLQQTLIPPTPPDIPGLEVAAAYRPAGSGEEVGGDFYDVFQVGAGDWVVVVGDVCGKGVEAAVVTALARHTIRAAAVHQRQPSEILRTLNEVLLHHQTDRFCTVSLMRLHHAERGWTATVSCGGHPPPLLVQGGRTPLAIGPRGSLLGVLTDATLLDSERELEPGDLVLLYTDGVTEARRGEEFLGDSGLGGIIARRAPLSTARALVDSVLEEVLAFQFGDPRDDIAVVGVAVP